MIEMWLKYHNQYSAGLYLAIGYYKHNCDSATDWASAGWWRLEPGQAAIVHYTTNGYSTFYAEADDGACWAGPYGPVYLPLGPFSDWCWDVGMSTPGLTVGMRSVYATNAWFPWIGTINLTS